MSIEKIIYRDKEILLVGTAHVSRQSADEVSEIIELEQPDTVCVELCASRYRSIMDRDGWQKTDIIKVIREHKSSLLLVNLILSSFQGRLAKQFGIRPGQEMIQGILSAHAIGADLVLADREIQITFQRLWHGLGIWDKTKLLFMIILSIFNDEELSEAEIEKLKSADMLAMALNDMSEGFPQLKNILIDERDIYLAQKIKNAPGNKIVAIVGAGHMTGVMDRITDEYDLSSLEYVPSKSKKTRILSWIIPLFIIIMIVSTFTIDSSIGRGQILSWILWNGTLSALGALIAFAHPISILVAFLAAPFTSLNPLLAAGWFAGLCEAYIKKPNVADFESLPEDLVSIRGFWTNKFTHILIVVALANIGSTAGTVIGGTEVVKTFINTLLN
ncbi:MAG: TraB/GumN family protein [Dehalobacter sp. 4CP]|nr:TraB/GumN family protein [Dehalobacter sp. 4CP]